MVEKHHKQNDDDSNDLQKPLLTDEGSDDVEYESESESGYYSSNYDSSYYDSSYYDSSYYDSSYYDSSRLSSSKYEDDDDDYDDDEDDDNDEDDDYDDDDFDEVQPQKFRDTHGAIIFLVHLLILIVIGFLFSGDAIKVATEAGHDVKGFLYALTTIVIVSFLGSIVMLRIMIDVGEILVQFLFLFAVGFGLFLVFGSSVTSKVIGILVIMFCISYFKIAWVSVPFATTNLVVALSCVKINFGIAYFSALSAFIMAVYTLLWAYAFIGASGLYHYCSENESLLHDFDANGEDKIENSCTADLWLYIPFLFVYIWTFRVLVNLVVIIAANVTEIWWTDPDNAVGCVSPAVKEAFVDCVFYKFGSVCWGSLFTPYITILNEIINPSKDVDALKTVCSSSFSDKFYSVVRSFNQWGFVFLGIYGYDFSTASRRALDMFHDKEWEPVIKHKLLKFVFFLVTFLLGLLTAEFASILDKETNFFEAAGQSSHLIALSVGFGIGTILGSIGIAGLTGSVLAVFVLFADDQEELEYNHTKLHERMFMAYLKAHPNIMN